MTPHELDLVLIALGAIFASCIWLPIRVRRADPEDKPGEMCQYCHGWCAPCRCCEDDLEEFDSAQMAPQDLPAR